MVSLTEHVSLSRETVRRRLAENDLKPRRKDMWCIPQVDVDPDAERIRVVQDNLSTHSAGALYQAFPLAHVPPRRRLELSGSQESATHLL
jgi:hypothetical protein